MKKNSFLRLIWACVFYALVAFLFFIFLTDYTLKQALLTAVMIGVVVTIPNWIAMKRIKKDNKR